MKKRIIVATMLSTMLLGALIGVSSPSFTKTAQAQSDGTGEATCYTASSLNFWSKISVGGTFTLDANGSADFQQYEMDHPAVIQSDGTGGYAANGTVTVSSDNPAVVSVAGRTSASSPVGTAAVDLITGITGVSAGTANIIVTYSGTDADGSGDSDNCDVNPGVAYPVTIVAVATTTSLYTGKASDFEPYQNLQGLFSSKGNGSTGKDCPTGDCSAYPTATQAICGVQGGSADSSGNPKANKLIVCNLTSTVQSYISQSSPDTTIDQLGSSPSDMYCPNPGSSNPTAAQIATFSTVNGAWVLRGVEAFGSSNQLDRGGCQVIFGVALASPVAVSPPAGGSDLADTPATSAFCAPDSIVVGGADNPGKNDSWGKVYCSQVLFPNGVLTPPAGTIDVNSVNSVTSAPLSATWWFNGPSGSVADTCGNPGSPCSGSSASYTNQPTGNGSYTINPIGAGGQYVLNSVTPFTNQSVPPNGTTNFNVSWDPLATLSLSANTMAFSGVQGGTSPAAQAVTLSNSGAPGSSLQWSSSVSYTNGFGWVAIAPFSNGTGLAQGASDHPSISVATTGLAVGTYKATVTFSGTSAPNNSVAPTPQTLAITLTVATAPPGVSVTVSPPSANVVVNATTTFTAVVNNSANQAVTWTVSAGGGAIDSTGLYTAPATVPGGPVTITAQSQDDPTATGTATVTVTSAPSLQFVTVNPPMWSMYTTDSPKQFTATVTGVVDQTVDWSKVSGPGNIDASGFFTPGGAGTTVIEADSASAPGATPGRATITVTFPPPPPSVTVMVSPAVVSIPANATTTFSATVTGTANQAVTWTVSAGGGAIDSTGLYTAPATVPGGPVTITAQSQDDPTATGTATVTVTSAATPNCTLTAFPTRLVPPQDSLLTWGCAAPLPGSCELTGTGLNIVADPAGGNVTTTPNTSTTYTLSCPAPQAVAQVTVIVGGPGLHETNP